MSDVLIATWITFFPACDACALLWSVYQLSVPLNRRTQRLFDRILASHANLENAAAKVSQDVFAYTHTDTHRHTHTQLSFPFQSERQAKPNMLTNWSIGDDPPDPPRGSTNEKTTVSHPGSAGRMLWSDAGVWWKGEKRKGELLQPGNHRGIKLPAWSEINYRQGSKNRFAHPF